MNIRKATLKDFDTLYEIGSNTPEFKASANEPFMDKDEFKKRIKSSKNVFLLAEENKKIVGFMVASIKDEDNPNENKYACMVYLVVIPEFRGKGIANQLYSEVEKRIKDMGMTHLYGWANAESESILKFMKNKGFAEGHKYIWIDKKIQ